MKQEKIFVVVKKPGGGSEILLAEKDPKAFSAAVEGKREIVPFPGLAGVCAIFDGEGQGKKKPACFMPEYGDLICGTVIFSGIDFDTGFLSLTEEQAVKIEEYVRVNDAKGFNGNAEEKIASAYLPMTEDNYLFSLLSEVKTKYKSPKLKWMSKR